MMTGGLLAKYLSPASRFLAREVEQEEKEKNQENDRYYVAQSDISSSCRPPPEPASSTTGFSLEVPPMQSVSLASISSSSSLSPVPSLCMTLSTLPSANSPTMTYSNNNMTRNVSNNYSSSSSSSNRSNVSPKNTSHPRGSGTHASSSSIYSYTSHSTRFQPFFVIPSLLLFIVSNQGIVRHAHGQQVWSDSHHSAAGFGQQYASFEELQRLTENPFENNTSVNLTVPLGDNAFLRCKVRNLGERSISWVRRRDWHILTSGKTTYTNDERFHVLHADGSDEWTLQIKFVQKRDAGVYECQVSTGTGIVSYLVHLRVTVPEVFILGNGEYHVEQGSTISLVCVIEKSPKPPEYIFWYHNHRMINYGSSREVKVINEPGSKTHSRLTIRDAQISDSGNYTCETAHAEPASTLVYISQGDQIAAIQKRKAAAAASSTSVTSFSLGSSHHHVAPLKLYLAISLINVTFLVPFLLSQSISSSVFNFIKNWILPLLFSTNATICPTRNTRSSEHHNQRRLLNKHEYFLTMQPQHFPIEDH